MNSAARPWFGVCILLLASAPAIHGQTYRVIGEYKLPGTSASGIAIDSGARRLFVGTGDGVTVLNADTGSAIGKITGLSHTHDVLLVPNAAEDEKPNFEKGVAGDNSGHVVVFSTAEMKALATLKLQTPGAVSLCYDREAKTIEAASAGGSLTSLDAETNKVINSGTVPTGTGAVVCGELNQVYIADPAANVVHVLNHQTMKDEGDIPMKSGTKPDGLSLDTKGRRLFVSCEDGTIEVIDTDAGFTFIELKGGTGPAHETFAWLPQGKGQWKAAAFIAQNDGTLSAVRMNAYINYSMGGQYKLKPGLGSVAYDEKTHHLFITSAEPGSAEVLVVGYESSPELQSMR